MGRGAELHRVLIISPHFPPDNSAGAHRVRLIAPYLQRYGWQPTVVTVNPRDYEGSLDWDLAALVPRTLKVVRCRAWAAKRTRLVGIGDLGLRALCALHRACLELARREAFHAVFVTIYPTYPAFLGVSLKRRFALPFVLDYQDPWISEWGRSVGPGRHGTPDLKSRVSRMVATCLEPLAVGHADALTAVSAGMLEGVVRRNPRLATLPRAVIPLGGESADFGMALSNPRPTSFFDPADGNCHVCYVGTLLPLGFETLRAFLTAVQRVRERHPELYRRLRLHFLGTSNQTSPGAAPRVIPIARALGLDDHVTEVAPRVEYLSALRALTQATVILLLGSSEGQYTASKLYPGLLARRPVLAIYHEESSVVSILSRAARAPVVRIITYGDVRRAEHEVERICEALVSLIETAAYDPELVNTEFVRQFSAESMAGKLATVLDMVGRR